MKVTSTQLRQNCDMNCADIDWNSIVANMPDTLRKQVCFEVERHLDALENRLHNLDDRAKQAIGTELFEERIEELQQMSLHVAMLGDDALRLSDKPVENVTALRR